MLKLIEEFVNYYKKNRINLEEYNKKYSRKNSHHSFLKKMENRWAIWAIPILGWLLEKILPQKWQARKSLFLQLSNGLISSVLVCVGFFLAVEFSVWWMFFVASVIFGQWFVDACDGSLGRYYGEGWYKAGKFMDHVWDYIFTVCILGGFGYLLFDFQITLSYLIFSLLITCFFVISFLESGNYPSTGYKWMSIAKVRLLLIIFVGLFPFLNLEKYWFLLEGVFWCLSVLLVVPIAMFMKYITAREMIVDKTKV